MMRARQHKIIESVEPDENIKRRVGRKHHLKGPWIEAFKKFGVVGPACEATNVARRTVYQWRKEDKEFNRQFQEADIHVNELLERAAMTRALVGFKRPVFQHGKKVGDEVEYSDTLLIWLMKLRDKRYANLFKGKVDTKFLRDLIESLVAVLKRNLPEKCPSCGTLFDLLGPIGRDLLSLSKKLTEARE